MSKPEIYVSIDVETDGPIPGPNSMLSLGAVAFNSDGRELGAFGVNLNTLPFAEADADTAKWWESQPEAWAACRKDCMPPDVAIRHYMAWVDVLCMQYRPTLVGYPILFDGMFHHWYIENFYGKDPFSFSGIDIKTYAMAVLGHGYRDSTKSNMPKRWFPPNSPHTHVAIEDAREQGLLFINILKDGEELRRPK